jgi:DNA/RNA-binding domain of Phe-tRNA-synthetase-like protein
MDTLSSVSICDHPFLDARIFQTDFPKALGEIGALDRVVECLSADADAPISRPENVKSVVRDLLRHGGYKPTGRGKPASEYLIRAVAENRLSSINLAVDACNAVSLHSGLPISVVDLDLTQPPIQIAIAPSGAEYVFNVSGQTMKLDGLLCLFDSEGSCANGVKDSQRTKTSPATTKTLTVIWGTKQLPGHADSTETWYHQLLQSAGATVKEIPGSVD